MIRRRSEFDVSGMRYFWAIFSAPFALFLFMLLSFFPDAIGSALEGVATIIAASIAVQAGVAAYLAAHVPIVSKEEKYFEIALATIDQASSHLASYSVIADDIKGQQPQVDSWLRYASAIDYVDEIDTSGLRSECIEMLPASTIKEIMGAQARILKLKNAMPVARRVLRDSLNDPGKVAHLKKNEGLYKRASEIMEYKIQRESIDLKNIYKNLMVFK